MAPLGHIVCLIVMIIVAVGVCRGRISCIGGVVFVVEYLRYVDYLLGLALRIVINRHHAVVARGLPLPYLVGTEQTVHRATGGGRLCALIIWRGVDMGMRIVGCIGRILFGVMCCISRRMGLGVVLRLRVSYRLLGSLHVGCRCGL